ncbi:hypothetical protein EV426DRAFT_353334 [Tirmania nivea]|nr:hypothetical protein EV426DRAFT_353334 [Tirmania nivea]
MRYKPRLGLVGLDVYKTLFEYFKASFFFLSTFTFFRFSTMPRRTIRKIFGGSNSQSWKPSEETSILVGLPAVVGIVPWIPPMAYLELSEIVHRQIEKLETTRHNREDPLFADLKLSNSKRSLTETLTEAKLTVEEFKKKQWRITTKNGKEILFAEIAGRVASQIGQYMGIIAPIAEATPFGAPVVWGAFNMLLKVDGYR